MEKKPTDEKLYVQFEQTGIGERTKDVPVWFLLLMLVLLAWGAYYLIKYWGGLGPGIGY